MKVSLLEEKGVLPFVEREIPKINNDEVLIKILKCSICGTDLHFYEHGRISDVVFKKPLFLDMSVAAKLSRLEKG